MKYKLVVLLLGAVLLASYGVSSVAAISGLAPNFTLTDIYGRTFSLSQYRGRVVILEFFATGCHKCQNEVADLKAVLNYFGSKVVIISLTKWGTVDSIKQFRTRFSISSSNWIMALDTTQKVYRLYGVGDAVPVIYIIDTNGYIRYLHYHTEPDASTLINEIKPLAGSTSSGLTVTAPNGGESWARGTARTITWTSSGSPGAYVKIELLKGGVVSGVLTSSTANDGSHSWTIPSTQTLGTDYRIRITSTTNPAITDSSNSNFAITAGTGALTVTTPNGGQYWRRGTTHTITWTKSGSTGSYVRIELLKAGVLNRVIVSSTANDGSHSWTIPSTQTIGTDYKIRITSTTYPSITDTSNSNFAITA